MRGKRQENRKCSVEGCVREVESKGLCSMHAKRARKHGSPLIRKITDNKGKICLVPACFNVAFSKGFWQQHYASIFKHGRTYLIMRKRGTGTITKDGYLEYNIAGERKLEHIILAKQALGKPLPPEAVVHHMNGDKLDNFTPFNLVICPDQAYHMLLHKRTKELGFGQ